MVSVEEEVLEQEEKGQIIEWDINDPNLASASVDINTEEVPVQLRPAPPPDGYHWVRFRPGNRKDKPFVYIKGTKGPDGKISSDGKVVAMLDGRVFNQETGQEGAFLKTWWPTTQVFKGSNGSQLTAIYFLAKGEPIKSLVPGRSVSLVDIRNAIETLFAEAGEEGILLFVKTRWIKSVPKTQDVLDSEGHPTGLLTYVNKPGTEDRDYEPEIKGEAKIKKLMALQGVTEERAHIWYEPVTGEERTVQAEVQSLEDPSKFNFSE
jgi:hypothetical protein